MARTILPSLLLLLTGVPLKAQTLVDSIPYPGMLNLAFWGIHVTPDTIFLGADGPGPVYFSDHQGNILGNQPTGYTYNHGLIKRPSSYLIAKDYTTQGSILHEVSLAGNLIQQWTFPPGVLGTSGGVGDLAEAGGGAIWFTVYFPQSLTYPFTYAYKWLPGESTFLDTVPLNGKQPYGVTVKGDTLFYVIDNLHGDQERIYAYDLTNEEDLFWFELPDTPIDNDQRPFGLHWDGNYLYLVANRQGGSAFAHQTIFIYSISGTTGIQQLELRTMGLHPNPATDQVTISLPESEVVRSVLFEITDGAGRVVRTERGAGVSTVLDVAGLPSGRYTIRALRDGVSFAQRKLVVAR